MLTGNRVNMYASTWLCTKTDDLSGSPSMCASKAEQTPWNDWKFNDERLLQLVQYPHPVDEVAMHIDSIDYLSA